MTEWLHFHFSLSCIGEGNGNPLQSSCLENPRDGGVWWVTIYGVLQSRTGLKWLSSSSRISKLIQPHWNWLKGYGFSSGHVWMWELDCEETDHWKIDAFELWCWGRHWRVPWIASRSRQSILKEISPQCSLEGLILKVKLQFFGHLMQTVDWLEKFLMLGGIEGGSRRGRQRIKWLYGIAYSMDVSLSKLPVLVMDRKAWRAVIHGVAKSQTPLSDWTELNMPLHMYTPQCPYAFIYQ